MGNKKIAKGFMKAFEALLEVADRLMGPKGCPWDQKQTLESLRPYILEEAYEVIDAVDMGPEQLAEELGDLLYVILFYTKLGEKLGLFSLVQVLEGVKEKLVRRHPHVFGQIQTDSLEEIKENWERIKKEEKGNRAPKSVWEGIPRDLPAIARAQKIVERLERASLLQEEGSIGPLSEEEIGQRMLALIRVAQQSGVSAELALGRALANLDPASATRQPQ